MNSFIIIKSVKRSSTDFHLKVVSGGEKMTTPLFNKRLSSRLLTIFRFMIYAKLRIIKYLT
jgi:hypothetical protein